MSKKLFKSPIILFDFDDGDDSDNVDGSGQGGYKMSYEAWCKTEWANKDWDSQGEIGTWEDYVWWWMNDQKFDGEPYHDPVQP